MSEAPKTPGKLESIQVVVNIVRDSLLLVLFLMLLVLPGTLNRILIEAGFTRASILGFDWEKQLEVAARQTEEAKQEVERLNAQLVAYSSRTDRIAEMVTQPAVRSQALELAREIRATQSVAAALGRNLESSLASQREVRSELKKRIQ